MALSQLFNAPSARGHCTRDNTADRGSDASTQAWDIHSIRAGASANCRDSTLGPASLGISSRQTVAAYRVREGQVSTTQDRSYVRSNEVGVPAWQAVAATRIRETGRHCEGSGPGSSVERTTFRARTVACLDTVRAYRGTAASTRATEAAVLPVAHHSTDTTRTTSNLAAMGSNRWWVRIFHARLLGISKDKPAYHRAFWPPRLYCARLHSRYPQLVAPTDKSAAAPTANQPRSLHPDRST